MKIKLDENLGRACARALEAAGHDVATVVRQRLAGAPDRLVIDVCRDEGRILVTLDQDFGNPLRFVPREYAGIVVLRLPRRPTPDDLLDAVQTLVAGLEVQDIMGKLWFVEAGRVREYQPDSVDLELS